MREIEDVELSYELLPLIPTIIDGDGIPEA